MTRTVGILLFTVLCSVALWPGTAHAGKRLALLVDNSGSMHGSCRSCKDVIPEVVTALEVVLELTQTYDDEHSEEPIEVILMLFGGRVGGADEFRVVALHDHMDIESALKEETYQDTDFAMAFENAASILEGQPADFTVFLTDGVSGTKLVPELPMDRFGSVSFYNLSESKSASSLLEKWCEAFLAAGVPAEYKPIRMGWEIIPSFAQAFCGFLVGDHPNRYLMFRRHEILDDRMLRFEKVSSGRATAYVIAHGEQRISVGKGPWEDVVTHGHVLAVEIPENVQGATDLALETVGGVPVVTAIVIEDAEIRVVDRAHNPNDEVKEHKRNQKISFDFRFAPVSGTRVLEPFDDEQQREMLDLTESMVKVFDDQGKEVWTTGQEGTPIELPPGHYVLKSGWKYKLTDGEPALVEVGRFSVSDTAGIELQVEVGPEPDDESLRGECDGGLLAHEAWQWRDAVIEARFQEEPGVEIPPDLIEADEISMRSGEHSVRLVRDGDVFRGRIDDDLRPGRYLFTLEDPAPESRGIVINGGELVVRARCQRLSLRLNAVGVAMSPDEENDGLQEQGLWDQVVQGFSHVLGMDREAAEWSETRVVEGPFPAQQPIWLRYYDEDQQILEVSLELEPLFPDEAEHLRMLYTYVGPDSFVADEVKLLGWLGFPRGESESVERALELEAVSTDASMQLVLHKLECDWIRPEKLTPQPRVRIEATLGGRRLPPLEVLIDIRIREYDKEIIAAIRGSVIVAFLTLVLVLLGFVGLLLLWWRRRRVRRAELWAGIEPLEPADFAERFPERAKDVLARWGKERGHEWPADAMRALSSDPQSSRRELERFRNGFSLAELRELEKSCTAPHLSGFWKVRGPSATIYGSRFVGGAAAVRLRDPSLPEELGRLTIEGQPGNRSISFTPTNAVVVKRTGDEELRPPHEEASMALGRSAAFMLGKRSGSYQVRVEVSVDDESMLIRSWEV